MSPKIGPWDLARTGFGSVQAVVGLCSAGSVIYGAHQLFLWYYHREWAGLQAAGVNECSGEDLIANGDLFDDAQTFCHQPENLVPWSVLYEHHLVVAIIYYGVVIIGLVLAGWLLHTLQRKEETPAPFGTSPALPSREFEHLR